MRIVIAGGGIVGLALALRLERCGFEPEVLEAAPALRELGVGITLLPHAMTEIAALGLAEAVERAGVEPEESAFFTRFGQLIYRERRGRRAGYAHPELCIHRGRLHGLLLEACRERLPGRIRTDFQVTAVEQDARGVRVHGRTSSTGESLPAVGGAVLIGCDGVHSAVRRQFYPNEEFAFGGIHTWRGVTRWPPIRGGRAYLRVGSIEQAKLVVYPIGEVGDGSGRQLVNFVAERQSPDRIANDWNRPGRLEEMLPLFESWRFDWFDVPAFLRAADVLLEYPMVDRDPVRRWSFGRVTLAGDAAHPMYPRGSNGAAQGLIDARVLTERLVAEPDPVAALRAYEAERLEATARVVTTNRTAPPDVINSRIAALTGDRPFDDLGRFISEAELRAMQDEYRRIAGFPLPGSA